MLLQHTWRENREHLSDARQPEVSFFSLLICHNAIKFVLLVFSVTLFKIDQNKIQNRPIDKVQHLGNERRYIYKNPRQDSSQRKISYTRYPKRCFTQTYRDLY